MVYMKHFAHINFFLSLQMTNIHIDLRRIIVEDWLKGEDKLKQRAMDILSKWEQLLLKNLDGYRWARVSSRSPLALQPNGPCNHRSHLSLVYVPRDKRRGERYFPTYRESDLLSHQLALRMASDSDALSIVYGLKLELPFEMTLWHRGYIWERRT